MNDSTTATAAAFLEAMLSRDAVRKKVSAGVRSESPEYVAPEERPKKTPVVTPSKLPRPKVHHAEKLARPEKRTHPQKQSRETRTSSAFSRKARASSRSRKARTSSASSRSREARTSSSSSRIRKARTSSAATRSRSPKDKHKAFLDSEHRRISCFFLILEN